MHKDFLFVRIAIGMTIKFIKSSVVPILKREGVVKAAVFGSVARGEAKKNSDVDMLIKFESGKSLLDLVRLEALLHKKLNRKVDLVTYGSIHPLLKKFILKDQKVIYDQRS